MPGIKKIVRDNIEKQLKAQNMTRAQLAKLTGIIPVRISQVLNDSAGLKEEQIEKIASALNVPVYQLFIAGGEESQPIQDRASDIKARINNILKEILPYDAIPNDYKRLTEMILHLEIPAVRKYLIKQHEKIKSMFDELISEYWINKVKRRE